ncbi:MAG: hypothetical protein Q9209_007984, partial [Squamulea sp. 1 TL-2023]
VTIVPGGFQAEGHRRPARKGAWSSYRKGGEQITSSPEHERGSRRRSYPWAIQLPPLNSPRNRPPQGALRADKGGPRALLHGSLERRIPAAQSRPKTVTGIGRPPNYLMVEIASGQSSTDPDDACGRTNPPTGLRSVAPNPQPTAGSAAGRTARRATIRSFHKLEPAHSDRLAPYLKLSTQ